MKRFLVFRGSRYYPSGGWEDFLTSAETLDVAKAAAEKDAWEKETFPWAHVMDMSTGKVVCHYDNSDNNDTVNWMDGNKWGEK